MKNTVDELSKLEYFENVSVNTINEILNNSEIKKYEPGHILFYDKEHVNIIYFMISGAVSLYKINENGQKKVVFILDKGKIVNEVIFKELPASINCEVIIESTILGIDREELMRILKEDFNLCKNIIYSLSMKTRRMYRQLKNTPLYNLVVTFDRKLFTILTNITCLN
ncbi:Cyclic nucleotide-binding domain-containing protein [Clostridium sp. DSM 8431]|uniref:Crp/Fnr family transcriptional regulator n=1 Tax=Clostridium sp. DSM 8431 TaxID=1761781 RepID=UPI0008F3C7ED|nr:cyclic nucleotide-binding domain-containing protein [Clostridium sp. DSM 8431]SFU82517.1 Cyclic nucleotide-binding domain-containing protein [Clostridium sp. DSM 8431]